MGLCVQFTQKHFRKHTNSDGSRIFVEFISAVSICSALFGEDQLVDRAETPCLHDIYIF